VHVEHVVEHRRDDVAAVRLEDERLDAAVAERLIAAGERAQVLDARDLEPHEVGGVVGDALGVRVGESHPHGGRERVTLHRALDMYSKCAIWV